MEIAGAIGRLVRMRLLTTSRLMRARKMALTLAEEWSVIAPTERIQKRAIELSARYDLRAGDALQLAAALEWCKDAPDGVIFLSADQRLRQAANLVGFDAKSV